MRSRRIAALIALGMAVAFAHAAPARAKPPQERHTWAALGAVHSIAVLPPVWCTRAPEHTSDARGEWFSEVIQRLRTRMSAGIDRAIRERGRYTVVPAAQCSSVLQRAGLSPDDLVDGLQEPRLPVWPSIERARAASIARNLHVDGVILILARDPSSIKDGLQIAHSHWSTNPLNWSLERIHAHVDSPHVMAALITTAGTEAWVDDDMAECPRTRPATQRSLEVDWDDATDQVCQQLVDSLFRLPPPGKRH